MATGKEKTILVYFLQKTSGTYSESSLAFLHDLLLREGIISSGVSIESLAARLAFFVRDGSYLKISTKKLSEHIRAQIDFHLQKSRRSQKKSGASTASSAFDELLASIDSDDPKFAMDTTLGLDFSSLEELESDLKRHALDSLSPSIFSRNNLHPTRSYANDATRANYANARVSNSDSEFDTDSVNDLYAQEKNQHEKENSSPSSLSSSQALENNGDEPFRQINSVAQQPVQDISSSQLSQPFANINFQNTGIQGQVPLFPSNNNGAQQFSQIYSNPVSFGIADVYSTTQKKEQQQFFAQLQLRASLIDAKERLLSSRIGSTNDPAVLRALALLDDKLVQHSNLVAQQQAQLQSQFQTQLQTQALAQQNSLSSLTPDALFSTPIINSQQHTTTLHTKSLASQIKSYVQEIIGTHKSMSELQSIFSPVAKPEQNREFQQISPTQVKEIAKQEKHDVTKLRAQLSALQEQFTQLSTQLSASISANSQSSMPGSRNNVRSQRMAGRIKVASLRATAVHSHTLRTNSHELAEPGQFSFNANDVNTASGSQTGAMDFGDDTNALQKMYALLAVGMRELVISPVRARHIYEQLQRLYATLSYDQKPIIYPSIVEFYASLTNQLRQVQGGLQ